MPQSLKSILGKSSRVQKPSRRNPSSPSPKKARQPKEEEVLFEERLTDLGTTRLLAEELTLRDVVQAMRYIRSTMFTPVPETGLKSTRVAEVLNYRASLPPVVTIGHLNSVLRSPTRTERELAELVAKGVVRKVRVERRGGMGEAVIETSDLERIVKRCDVSDEAADKFLACLRQNPTAQMLPSGALTSTQTDELVRAGLLTSSAHAAPGSTLHVRPEDRTTLTSILHVSRFASGTVSAVGGHQAIHLAGGGGGAPTLTRAAASSSSAAPPPSSFRISLPGHGRYLKLAEGAVDWVREALGKTAWGEGPEDWLRERFAGGGLYGTRWKEFWGVEWQWLAGQAVGLGVVEMFETGSVGRGVRAFG
ncbi:serine-threonine protein kinase [Hirsutella rhossiliensis]|uniref:Serine-threonine protein kinase n=1 Tax=Hirsutella rhossiliensis TaxID=111463 RepID=A0A9P8SNJ6_9HYPO|nr:serine-threonine protein kinase [Hirsutella rhossiliensis]KAH0967236.1 serine-threonine protein kinase [Hirsutella rhossiliensis]